MLNELGISDFGVYNAVAGVVSMFAFVNNAMAGATSRFLSFDLGKEDYHVLSKTFNLSVSIHLIIAGSILILGETIGLWFVANKLVIPADRMESALWVYHFSIVAAVIGFLTVPYLAIINAYEKMKIYSMVSIIEVVLRLLIVLLLPFIKYDKLKTYAILSSFISILVFVIFYVVCFRLFRETRIKRLIWDSVLFKRMAVFAGWVMNGNLAFVAYTQGINILLNIFFGPAVNAARGIALQVQNAVNNFSHNFQKAMNPQITKAYAVGEIERMHRLVFSSSKITFFLVFMVFIPIYFETDFILMKWLNQVPEYTSIFVKLTMIISVISSLSYSLVVSIHANGNIRKFQLWEGGILLLIIPISYVLLKSGFGPTSTLIVHLIISILVQIVRVLIVSKAVEFSNLTYFNKVLLKLCITIPFCMVFPYIIFHYMEEGWIRLLLLSVVSLLSVGGFGYLLGLDQTEKEFVNHFLTKFKRKMA
ncbi:lipopolysaccharide biosynthesis protein [Sphingobacterium sp. DK4209]|uniref:Lipopolysaccharide biosynthesis protein n=1 Tax=Sphingobacterium zhuxiongii TaxID=2662364 RepID=A0A5Q0QGI1_9SPHI|nr:MULTISPECIES: lipopolysaccharide biosynthesis protein [unclassified Sphingobacterium]MVZ65280.1 lipopolysaccharide biosynthesis protein [Sphingobacterium sp. DK4209]QGA26370.1 lipopolysaccharide biosynthesis protein [Sphingobacterium sp. dk4302]